MVFGVLKDIKIGENRVICTPIEVASIVAAGHEVLVQRDAGIGAGFSNEAYAKAGAKIADTAAQLWEKCDFLAKVKEMLSPLGFGSFNITDAEFHDAEIAYTSQLAHVVSNAFVKSPAAQTHKGYSAGSYKDLTRVAWLNETMWTQLFTENKDFLLNELNIMIDSLNEYKTALENDDPEKLKELLKEGRECKERADG